MKTSETTGSATGDDPSSDPNLIKAFDRYGREVYVTRDEWKNSVLVPNLERARSNADELYGLIVAALHGGFGADLVTYGEHLARIDPVPARAATVLGILYME